MTSMQNANLVVNIKPLRMVVHFLSQ